MVSPLDLVPSKFRLHCFAYIKSPVFIVLDFLSERLQASKKNNFAEICENFSTPPPPPPPPPPKKKKKKKRKEKRKKKAT